MANRYVSIWFPFFRTDWYTRQHPELLKMPFILTTIERNRSVITAVNPAAQQLNIFKGMSAADARAIYPGLLVKDDETISSASLLEKFTQWFIRFSPFVATDSQ